MKLARPLFDVDPGWLFILAGLTLCVAGVLIPAQKDLFHLHRQRDSLRGSEQIGSERLRTHAQFIGELEETDPALVRRLAASQLNVAPIGDVPVVLSSTADAALTDWIEARAVVASGTERTSATHWPDTTLTRLATGPQRLWLLGGGVLAVFVGLMLGPSTAATRLVSAGNNAAANDREAVFARTHSANDESPAESQMQCRPDLLVEAADRGMCFGTQSSIIATEEEVLCEVLTARQFAAGASEWNRRCTRMV